MESPKEQHLIHAGMDNETPLLILKSSLYRIRWKLFFYSIFFVVFFLRGSLPVFRGNWEYVHYKEVIYCFLMFFNGVQIVDMLFVRSFNLYSDRAEKHYVFYVKTIYLEEAKMSIFLSKGLGVNYLYITPNGNCFYCLWKRIAYDLSLGDCGVDVKSIIDSCKLVGIEFKRNSSFFNEKYEQI